MVACAVAGRSQEHRRRMGEAEASRVTPGLVAWKVACGGHGWDREALGSRGWVSRWRQEQATAPESGLGREDQDVATEIGDCCAWRG